MLIFSHLAKNRERAVDEVKLIVIFFPYEKVDVFKNLRSISIKTKSEEKRVARPFSQIRTTVAVLAEAVEAVRDRILGSGRIRGSEARLQ